MAGRRLKTIGLLGALVLTGDATYGDLPPRLRFGWPDGITANVEARSSGQRISRGRATSWNLSCTYQLVVRRTDAEVRIERRGFSGWRGTQPLWLAGAPERAIDTIPTLVASRRGAFLGIQGAEKAKQLLRAGALLSGPAEEPLLDALTTEAALTALAREYWSVAVELWLGQPVDGFEAFEFRSRVRVPELDGAEVDMVGTADSRGATDCVRGGTTRRCLTLALRASADPDQAAALVESRPDRPLAGGQRITAFERSLEATVVVESRTLLPHQITIRRSWAFTLEPSGSEQAMRAGEQSTKEYRFSYLAP